MRQKDEKEEGLSLWHLAAGMGWGVVFCLLISMCSSCKSIQYVPVTTTHTDTLYQVKTERDSVFRHDSIYVREWMKGDTVYLERTRESVRWRDRWKTDTVYKSRVDTVAVPYPVEKRLNYWQRFCLDYGKVTTGCTIALIMMVAVRIFGNRRGS